MTLNGLLIEEMFYLIDNHPHLYLNLITHCSGKQINVSNDKLSSMMGLTRLIHLPLIDEEYPCSRKSGVGGISQFTDSGVVNKASDEQH